MWRNLLLSAVVSCVVGGAIARADIFISLDGEDLTDSIVLADYPGQFIVAIEGNTSFEPNDISVEVINGTLEPVGDGNTSYYFQFVNEGESAVNIITKVDMTIDGVSVPENTLIYQLWLYYNPYVNLYAGFGTGLADLFIPPEEEDVQQDEPPSDNIDQPTEIIEEEEPNEPEAEPLPEVDYNLPPIKASEWELRKVLLHCPNIDEEIISYQHNREEVESLNMYGEGGGQLMLDGTIEISSDITTNQIWTADNTYYITASINVQALLVIEPGTIIEFAYDTAMYVNNGGTLISSGMPDNPIIYTCDFLYPDWGYYWQYLPEYGYYYFCPIYIEETASPATTVTYSFIEGSLVGIVTNNITLDHPIENNYLIGNIYGIGEYGTRHTDITNNLCYFNDTSGIDVHLADVNGVGDANSIITISNNTCDSYQYCGITIHGVEIEQDAGWAVLVNNIVSESYQYGISLVDNYLYASVFNTGYYGNPVNKNWEFDEYNPVFEDEMPYVEGTGILPICYLQQDCNFVNNGFEYIEQTRLIGKTTDVNCFLDSNIVDLGFHYPNWDYSNAGEGNGLTMDLNADLIVNFKDFAILAARWQTTYNINDLNIMADQWLQIANAHPPITVTVSGEPNNLTGDVNVGVTGFAFVTDRVFAFMDGEFIDELEYFDSNTPLLLESDNYRNGSHSIKLVAIDINGLVTVSDALEVDFNNTFFNIIVSDYFHPTADYKILGFHNGTGSFETKITDYDDQILWSNTYSGSSVNIIVPGTSFGSEQLCGLSITAAASGVTERDIAKKFKPSDCPANVKMVIVLPNKDVFKCRRPAIIECARACDRRNVSWVSLYHHDVNEGHLRFLYNKSSVKYVYWCGHANSHVGRNEKQGIEGVQRTHTICWKYEPSWWHFNWQQIGVFSWIDTDYPLPDDWDTRGFSLWSLNMSDSGNKKIVFVDGCFSAKFDDMAAAYGMYSLWNAGNHDQIYIGWRIEAVTAPPGSIFDWVLWSTDGVKLFWERMGLGDDVYDALSYTASSGGGGIQRTLWGPNGLMDLYEPYEESDDNIWIYGEGINAELEP